MAARTPLALCLDRQRPEHPGFTMFHVQLTRSQIWRRDLAYQRWIRSLEREFGPLPRRGPPRPDVVYRNRRRMVENWRRYDDWLDFKARSDARAKAWQAKHPPEKATAYKRA